MPINYLLPTYLLNYLPSTFLLNHLPTTYLFNYLATTCLFNYLPGTYYLLQQLLYKDWGTVLVVLLLVPEVAPPQTMASRIVGSAGRKMALLIPTAAALVPMLCQSSAPSSALSEPSPPPPSPSTHYSFPPSTNHFVWCLWQVSCSPSSTHSFHLSPLALFVLHIMSPQFLNLWKNVVEFMDGALGFRVSSRILFFWPSSSCTAGASSSTWESFCLSPSFTSVKKCCGFHV